MCELRKRRSRTLIPLPSNSSNAAVLHRRGRQLQHICRIQLPGAFQSPRVHSSVKTSSPPRCGPACEGALVRRLGPSSQLVIATCVAFPPKPRARGTVRRFGALPLPSPQKCGPGLMRVGPFCRVIPKRCHARDVRMRCRLPCHLPDPNFEVHVLVAGCFDFPSHADALNPKTVVKATPPLALPRIVLPPIRACRLP